MSADTRKVADCRHCGKRIVIRNYATGQRWEHQEPGAAFANGIYTYCRITAAEPDPEAGPR